MSFGRVLLLACGLAALASGCGAPTESGLHEHANHALKEARLDQVQAEWDAGARTLHLRGFVLSPDDKRRAEAVARDIVGSQGQVANELAITTRGAPTPAPVLASAEDLKLIDERIHDDVRAIFADESVWGGRDFEILVHAGEVRLTGTVFSQDEKDRVTELVAAVAGVKSVVNRLAIRNPEDPGRSS